MAMEGRRDIVAMEGGVIAKGGEVIAMEERGAYSYAKGGEIAATERGEVCSNGEGLVATKGKGVGLGCS